MFELYALQEFSVVLLSDQLQAEGLRYINGQRVTKSRIHQLLSNPFYYGKILWNGKLYQGKQEPIITQELFDQVQKVLTRKGTPKYSKHYFLFRQLLTCKECKGTITWETQKKHVYGHCNHFKTCFQRTYVKEEAIEKQLIHAIANLRIKNPRINNWLIKVLEYGKQETVQNSHIILSNLQEKLNLIEKQIDNLYDDKSAEKINEEFYDRKNAQYTKDKESLKTSIKNNSGNNAKNAEIALDVFKLSQKATDLYKNKKTRPEQKRELLKLIFEDLKLDGSIVEYIYTEGFILLYALVNSFNRSKLQNIDKFFDSTFERVDKIAISRQIDSFEAIYPGVLPSLDSNQNFCFQRAECYHYTTRQYWMFLVVQLY